MKKKYHHLTYEDRTVIKVLLQENKTYSYIARVCWSIQVHHKQRNTAQ